MIIGYARVSTSDQDLSLQIDALKKAGCERIYKEKESGSTKNRDGLRACFEALREGDKLIIWKLDRLGRSTKDLIELVEKLQGLSVEIVSLQDNIDTSSATGKLVFHIFSALAEFESSMIRERTMAGLAAARQRGRIGGRKQKLSKKDLQLAQTMLTQHSVTEVASHFKVDRRTLRRSLDRVLKAKAT